MKNKDKKTMKIKVVAVQNKQNRETRDQKTREKGGLSKTKEKRKAHHNSQPDELKTFVKENFYLQNIEIRDKDSKNLVSNRKEKIKTKILPDIQKTINNGRAISPTNVKEINYFFNNSTEDDDIINKNFY